MGKDFSDKYCLPVYGNEECIPGQKQADQSRKEIGSMDTIQRDDVFKSTLTGIEWTGGDVDWKDAGDELDRKTKQYCLENGTPYEEGFHEVKKANPELYKRYTLR